MTFHDIFDRYSKPLEPVSAGLAPSGSCKHPVKAILFDVYGTLFVSASGDLGGIRDTGPSDDVGDFRESRKALGQLAADWGLSLSPGRLLRAYARAVENEQHQLFTKGIDFPEIQIDLVWHKILGFDDIHQARRFALHFELIINPVYPMPYAGRMLSRIRRAGLKTGIISNAQFYTPLTFEYFLGNLPEKMGFDPALLIYSYRKGRAKPSPMLFGAAAQTLREYSIFPENVLFLGNDMRNDILPARRMGFQTALFAGDRRSLRLRSDDPCCRDVQPDIIITDLSRLPEMAVKKGGRP